jgi:hypothetical protein
MDSGAFSSAKPLLYFRGGFSALGVSFLLIFEGSGKHGEFGLLAKIIGVDLILP